LAAEQADERREVDPDELWGQAVCVAAFTDHQDSGPAPTERHEATERRNGAISRRLAHAGEFVVELEDAAGCPLVSSAASRVNLRDACLP